MSFGSVGRIRSISSRSALRHVELVRADERPDAEVHAFLLAVLRDRMASSAPSSTRATSLRRTMAPSRSATMRSANSSAERRSVLASRLTCTRLPFVWPDRREIVVALERGLHVAGREIERGEPIRIDPHAHGELAPAFDGHALHACDRRELRLQRAHQPVGDRRHAALLRSEAEIERGVRPVRALHLDDGRLRLLRQFGAHLLQARGDFRERRRAVVIQLQAHGDRADAGAAASTRCSRRRRSRTPRARSASSGSRAPSRRWRRSTWS